MKSIAILIFLILLKFIKNDDLIEDEKFYVNIKQQALLLNENSTKIFIGKINNSEFETPYYLIPIQPLDANELKNLVDINLDNGNIFLIKNNTSSISSGDYLKFTILSILKGTSKQIYIYFTNTNSTTFATTSSTSTTTFESTSSGGDEDNVPSLTSSKFIPKLLSSNQTVVELEIKILNKYFILLNKTNLILNQIISRIKLSNLNSTINCKLYCNYKQILNYFKYDTSSGNLILINKNLLVNFIQFELYHDVSTLSIVYIYVQSSVLPTASFTYSTVVLSDNLNEIINVNNIDSDIQLVSFVSLNNNAYQLLNDQIDSTGSYEIETVDDQRVQIRSINRISKSILLDFVVVICSSNQTTECNFLFKQLSVLYVDDQADDGNRNCSLIDLNADIYLDSIFVNTKQPIFKLDENFLFNYKYSNLSQVLVLDENDADFGDYFLFQNGFIYQYNYLPVDFYRKYQLKLDVFNRSLVELNNKFDVYFYSCRLNVNLEMRIKEASVKFNKNFYNISLLSSVVSAAAAADVNEILLANFINELNSLDFNSYYRFSMVNLATNNESYFEINRITGALLLVNNNYGFDRRSLNKYLYRIDCEILNSNQVARTFIEINIIDDNKPCVPIIKTDSVIYYNLVSGNNGLIKLPKADFIAQFLVNECDSRTFNTRQFGFNLTADDQTQFYNYFNFNSVNGVLTTSATNDAIIDTTLYTSTNFYKFKFNVKIYDLANSCLSSSKQFEIKLNIQTDTSQLNATNSTEIYFKQKIFKAKIEENVSIGTLIEFINQTTVLNIASLTNIQQYSFKLIDPTSTFILIDTKIQQKLNLPRISTAKPIDRESINNYTFFLYITDLKTQQLFYDSCVILIDILDVNDNPPILNRLATNNTNNSIEFSLYENLDSIYEITLQSVDYDIDENARLTYKILNFSAIKNQTVDFYTSLPGTFDIDTQTGVFRVKRPLDYELYSRYEFNIQINDNGQSNQFKLIIKLILNIIDVNDNSPQIDDSFNLIRLDLIKNFTLQLATPTDEIFLAQYFQSTFDADSDFNMNNKFNYSLLNYEIQISQNIFKNLNIFLIFRIDTLNGQLYCRLLPMLLDNNVQSETFGDDFKYNDTKSYNLTITTTDLGLPKSLTANKIVRLELSINLNKTTFDLLNNQLQLLIYNSTPILYQNSYVANFEEGLPIRTFVLKFKTYSAVPSKWLSWYRIMSGNLDNSFKLDNLQMETDSNLNEMNLITNRILDREIRSTYRLKIAVFYQTNTTNPNDRILLTDYIYAYINIIDINDNAPNFLIPQLNLTINENYDINKQIDTSVQAYDADAFSIIEYSLVDYNTQSQNLINIDRYTGALTVNSNIDYETVNVLKYKVIASDGVFKAEMDLIINISDLNDNLPLLPLSQLETKHLLSSNNTASLNFTGFDYDATQLNSKIFYELFDYKNSNTILSVSNDGKFVTTSFSQLNSSVLIVRLSNVSPVYRTNVTSYSILYLIPNNQTNSKSISSIVRLEMHDYRFYVKKSNQIGNKIASMKLISDGYINDDFSFKVNTNQTLPFKCVFNQNQSTLDLVLTSYLTQPVFELEIQMDSSNKTKVLVRVYSDNDFAIRNIESITINVTNEGDLIKNKILYINNLNIERDTYQLSLLPSEMFDLYGNMLSLNKTKFQNYLSNLRADLVNLAEYCLINNNFIQIDSDLVITVTTQFDQNIFSLNNIHVNIFISCDYLVSLPQLNIPSLDAAQFALDRYEIQVRENDNSNLFKFHYYPENFMNKIGLNTKFYIQNTDLFRIGLNDGILKADTKFNFENTTSQLQQQYNFKIVGVTQSISSGIVKSMSTNVQVNLIDSDDYKPVLNIEKPIVYIFANHSLGAKITQFNANDADNGACGRTLFYFYKPAQFIKKYFYLNKFTGDLILKSKLNQLFLNSEQDDEIIQNSLLLSNSLLIELLIEVNSGLSNSQYTRGKIQVFIDYNCIDCSYTISSLSNDTQNSTRQSITINNPDSPFVNSVWSIVLICVFGLIALLLAILLIVLKFRNTKCRKSRNVKANASSKQTSESSLFYNSSNASTCSHISDKSALSFSKVNTNSNNTIDVDEVRQLNSNTNNNRNTLSSHSTALTTNSFNEQEQHQNNMELLKKLTIPFSSTIGGGSSSEDRFQYLHPIRNANKPNRSHFEEYLNRLGIQSSATMGNMNSEEHLLNVPKSKSSSILTTSVSYLSDATRPQYVMQQPSSHFYHSFQSSNEDIDNVMVDLKEIVGEQNLANIDIQSIEDYVKLNRSRISLTNNQQRTQQAKLNMSSNPVLLTSTILPPSSDAGSYNNSTIDSNFNDEELSFQKWDTLLDWTPQYAPLSHIFEDLTRLSTEQQQQQKQQEPPQAPSQQQYYQKYLTEPVVEQYQQEQILNNENEIPLANKIFLTNFTPPESSLGSSSYKLKNADNPDYQYYLTEENDSEI